VYHVGVRGFGDARNDWRIRGSTADEARHALCDAHCMHVGIMFANTGPGSSAPGAVALAQEAEAIGFESLWTVEHVVVPSGYESKYPYDPSGKMAGGAEEFDLPDPLVWMAYVAASTSRIKLGTGILIVPQRNPVITAKEVATLDHLSGGRVLLGVGVGWLEEEFAALGVPFAGRGARLDEYIGAMRELWTADKASVHGRFVDFTDCISRPRPANGTVPVVIGGHTPAAARRAGRLGDGFFPGNASAEEIADLVQIVRSSATEAGRDPDAIELSAMTGGRGDRLLQRVEALHQIGITRVIVGVAPTDVLASTCEAIQSRFG
jgi:probable F420-dependent oxidoreductase